MIIKLLIQAFILASILALGLGCREESKNSYAFRPVEHQIFNPTAQPTPIRSGRLQTNLPLPPPPPPPAPWDWKLFQVSQLSTKVDVIFILDDSGSMTPHLDRVRRNLTDFAKILTGRQGDHLIGLNIRVGFLSINDPYGHRYRPPAGTSVAGELMPVSRKSPVKRWIDSHQEIDSQVQPRNFQVFQSELLEAYQLHARVRPVRIGGPEFEDFLTPLANFALRAQQPDTPERSFLRENAHLLVFFVTNGDSENGNHDPDLVVPPRLAHHYLVQALGGDSSRLHAMGAMMVLDSHESNKDPGMRIGLEGGDTGMPQCFRMVKISRNEWQRKKRDPSPPECTQRRGPVVLEEFIRLANQQTTEASQTRFQKQAIVRLDERNFSEGFASAARSLVQDLSEFIIPLGDTRPSRDQQGHLMIDGRTFVIESYRAKLSDILNITIPVFHSISGLVPLLDSSNQIIGFNNLQRLQNEIGGRNQSQYLFRFLVAQNGRWPAENNAQAHGALNLALYNPADNTLRVRLNSQMRALSFRTPIGIWIGWDRALTPTEATDNTVATNH